MANGVIGRFGKAAVLVSAAAAMGLGLGGCNNKEKEQITLLTQENEALRNQTATLEQGLRDKDSQIASSQSQLDTLRSQVNDLQNRVNTQPAAPAGGAWTGGSGGGGDVVISVAGDVLFDSGSVTIKQSARRELDSIASQLNNRYAGHSIRIDGYTDKTPIRKSRFGSNEALSKARAESVEAYLTSKGVSADRITTRGMGAANPKSTNAASRRVEIVVLGK